MLAGCSQFQKSPKSCKAGALLPAVLSLKYLWSEFNLSTVHGWLYLCATICCFAFNNCCEVLREPSPGGCAALQWCLQSIVEGMDRGLSCWAGNRLELEECWCGSLLCISFEIWKCWDAKELWRDGPLLHRPFIDSWCSLKSSCDGAMPKAYR